MDTQEDPKLRAAHGQRVLEQIASNGGLRVPEPSPSAEQPQVERLPAGDTEGGAA
jgi:hypothetical protein